MLTEKQLINRKAGIGGSDIGAVLGLNPKRSRLEVYLDKTGQLPDVDLSNNPHVHFGNVLEDIVAKEYERRTGFKVRRRNKMFQHPKYPWMLANIDRSVDGQKKVLECKTASAWVRGRWGKENTDEVPEYYLCQPHWYMSILNYNSADMAALIDTWDFRIYKFERDFELEDMMIRKSGEFWNNHVLKGIPPEPETDRDLELMYAKDNGRAIMATPEIEEIAKELSLLKEKYKFTEKQIKKAEFAIKKFIGGNAEVLYSEENKKLATWKHNKDREYFDKKTFRETLPEIYDSFTETRKGARPFYLKI